MLEQEETVPIIGVPNPVSDRGDVAQFIDDVGPEVRHIVDGAREIWDEHQVITQPTTLLISSDGSVERINSFGRSGLLIRLRELAAD